VIFMGIFQSGLVVKQWTGRFLMVFALLIACGIPTERSISESQRQIQTVV
jgi:hypothetical protein